MERQKASFKTKLERDFKRLVGEDVKARVMSRGIREKILQAEKREKNHTEERLAALEEKSKAFEEKRKKQKESEEEAKKFRDEKLQKLMDNIAEKTKNKEKLEEEKKEQLKEKDMEYKEKVKAIKQHLSASSVAEDEKRFVQLLELEKECMIGFIADFI